MKFGIFYELQLPRPWGVDDERQLYQNALTQVELADRLGYDYAWEVEHHFLEEYSHSPAPEVFLGAASQRTKNIRLGHGIVQLTTNPPQRVAERIACLDLVSNGRVEFGTGESASITELGGFGRDMETKREVWEDAIRCIIPMFQDKGVELDTKWHKMPMRNVLPKPVQKPHPPLWVACSQLETIEMAGRRGLGALGFQFLSADAAHAWVHAYYNASSSSRRSWPTTRPIRTSRWSATSCVPKPMKRRAGARMARRSSSSRCAITARARGASGRIRTRSTCGTNTTSGSARTPRRRRARMSGGLIGSPETMRRKLRRFRTSNIDQVILLNQAGKNAHAHICESLELFAKEVMPEFHADEPAHQEWKRKVLAREIELEEIDTTPYRERFGPNTVPIPARPAAAE